MQFMTVTLKDHKLFQESYNMEIVKLTAICINMVNSEKS